MGRKIARYLFVYFSALAVMFVSVFPFLWMLSTSLKRNRDIFSLTPKIIPPVATIEHYATVFSQSNFPRYFMNSAIIAVATTFLGIGVAALAAYAFSRFRFAGKKMLLVMILAVQMFPAVVLIIPLFIVMRRLDLLNTYQGLVITYITFTLPFGVWMLKGFFDAIPNELEQAAMIDGCGRMGAFLRVVLPVAGPGLAATSIYSFIAAWNDFMFAITFINKEEMSTLPMALQSFFGQFTVEWGPVMAASVIFTIPVLGFFLVVQKQLTTGMVKGAVKG
ncbi:MAG: carbohydrate ABC transporter permease [Firmicutes bacterium]|nr:carbohydrate ABC transporter permease [Bacillota bacterium]